MSVFVCVCVNRCSNNPAAEYLEEVMTKKVFFFCQLTTLSEDNDDSVSRLMNRLALIARGANLGYSNL